MKWKVIYSLSFCLIFLLFTVNLISQKQLVFHELKQKIEFLFLIAVQVNYYYALIHIVTLHWLKMLVWITMS